MNDFTYTMAGLMMQLTTNFKKYFMKEVAMTELLIFLVISGLCFVLPSLFEQSSEKNEEHIINSPWLNSRDKFRFVSRWGA